MKLNSSALMRVAAFALVLGATGPAVAQQGNFDDKYLRGARPGNAGRLQKQIDVDYVDTDLRQVMEDIGRKVGRNILVAPGIEETVTITLRDLPWLNAVRIISKLKKCEIEETVEGVLLLTQPPKVTIQFNDTNVRTVLQLLAAYSGKNIIISPAVTGKVTLDLKDVHWEKALESIVKTVGPFVVVRDGEDLIRVVPRESVESQLETTLIKLKYVRPPARYLAIPPKTSSGTTNNAGTIFAGKRPSANADNPEESFTLFRALRGIIDATPIAQDSIQYDEGTNTFLITATKPTTDEINTIVRKVDTEPTQVFIEIRFISTSSRNFLETGLKFGGGDLQNGLRLAGPFPSGTQIGSRRFNPDTLAGIAPIAPVAGVQPAGVLQPVGLYPFLLGDGQDAFARNFNLPAILDATGLNATLNWIDSVESTRIIQEPSLFTLDNQPALIFVGDNVPYAETKATNDINGNVNVTISAGAQSPISIGFSLFIQPHVVPETDKIIMTVIPRVNQLTGTSSPIGGFERFAFSQTNFIDLPRTSEQAVVTRILIEDGNTAVIGGLLSTSETDTLIKIPFLSAIPLLGNLFKNKINRKEVRNLVIFVTPTIVRTRRQGRSLFNRINQRQFDNDPLFNKKQRPKTKAKESTKEKGK